MTNAFRSAGAFALGFATVLLAGEAMADQIIPTDLGVRGRVCIGNLCANNEPFNASTLRLKGNNLRIDLIDNSASFNAPLRDWRIEANSGIVGGPAYLALKDLGNEATGVEGGVAVFQLRSGAPANSLFIASDGDIGMGTAAPGKDLHIIDGSTPTLRLQQDTSGGRSARAWDVGGNEFGFFVNDIVSSSITRTPFGIAAGAPSSSLVVGPSGNVGLGVVPTARLHTIGTVRFGDLPNCASGIKSNNIGLLSCITSSRRFKNIAGDLSAEVALANVMALQPKVGAYKETPQEPEHWLIAEEAADVDPALVGMQDGAPFTVKTQNVVADLVTVIQHQQKIIEAQERRLAALEKSIAQ